MLSTANSAVVRMGSVFPSGAVTTTAKRAFLDAGIDVPASYRCTVTVCVVGSYVYSPTTPNVTLVLVASTTETGETVEAVEAVEAAEADEEEEEGKTSAVFGVCVSYPTSASVTELVSPAPHTDVAASASGPYPAPSAIAPIDASSVSTVSTGPEIAIVAARPVGNAYTRAAVSASAVGVYSTVTAPYVTASVAYASCFALGVTTLSSVVVAACCTVVSALATPIMVVVYFAPVGTPSGPPRFHITVASRPRVTIDPPAGPLLSTTHVTVGASGNR